MRVNILCAMRDSRMARSLGMELDDGERCTLFTVTNGLEAIEACRRVAPDILVVDAVLPGMDGLGVVDRLQGLMGDRMPRVIGGSMMRFADEGFRRRGAAAVVRVPWERETLRSALLLQMEDFELRVDWEAARGAYVRACQLLSGMGMQSALKGYEYLAWSAALAYENEERLRAVGKRIYRPLAERFSTTPQNVERLIRHAVERMMDAARNRGVYHFFGNTIDSARGKPTNAQCISALAQRLRIS